MTDSRVETLQQTYRRLEKLSKSFKQKLNEPIKKSIQSQSNLKNISKQEYQRYKEILYPNQHRQQQQKELQESQNRKSKVVGQIISRKRNQEVQVDHNQSIPQQQVDQYQQEQNIQIDNRNVKEVQTHNILDYIECEPQNQQSQYLDIDQLVQNTIENSEENKEIQKLMKEQEMIKQSLKSLQYYEQPIRKNCKNGSTKQITGQFLKEWDSLEKGMNETKKQIHYDLHRIEEEI